MVGISGSAKFLFFGFEPFLHSRGQVSDGQTQSHGIVLYRISA